MKNSLGQNIRTLRKEKGWTQTDLAKKLACSQEVVGAYERGSRKPPADKLPSIAKILDVSINALYNIVPSQTKQPANGKLIKKLKEVEALPSKAQKQVADYINLVLKANKAA